MRNKIVGISLAVLGLTACGGSDSDGTVSDACNELSSDTFSCDTMLNDLVTEGVKPLVTEFKTELADLDEAVDAYCDASGTKELAQTAWSNAMVPLQKMQTMNFGPNADTENGLVSFYDWQTASESNIDIAIAKNAIDESGLSTIDNRKDLIAIEYILFTTDNTVTNTSNSTVDTWQTDSADIQADRCDYAQLITEDLKTRAVTLESAWHSYDLASVANSKQAAANEVTQAFFYADKQIKDAKVKSALPQDSSENFDASELESQFANTSKEHLINNLEGLKQILNAGDGVGIDDYLVAVGEPEVATLLNNQIDAAIDNLDAIENTLYSAVETGTTLETCSSLANNGSAETNLSDVEELCKFQYTIKQLTDTLKGDFVLSTEFTIPASASGDND